jgi:hypothetical protein
MLGAFQPVEEHLMIWRSFVPRILQASVTLGAAMSIVLCAPAGAQGAPSVLPSCVGQAFEQPFLPWADPASYVLAPGGSFEARQRVWALHGARVVNGNEPFFVHSASESRALQLPAGASATSPAICVGLAYPTVRMFALRSGSATSRLRVEVLFATPDRTIRAATIALLPGTTSWAPTLPMTLAGNLPATLDPQRAAVALRFSVLGSGATWRIDDVYVDPFRKS